MSRLLIVHFAGDFREAWQRLQRDGTERYYGHRYILEQLALIAQRHGAAGYLSCLAPPYVEHLPGGVTVMGAGTNPARNPQAIIRMIADYDPTHLIVHGPMPAFIRWGIRRGIRVGCVFADSFEMNPLYRWLRFARLPRLLNDSGVSLLANHGVNAARSLAALGADPGKIMAWDYPHIRTPDQFAPKAGRLSSGPFTLLYVGSIERKKGVGDLISALALLGPHADVRLRIAGAGRVEQMRALAQRLGVADRVEFMGLVANGTIPQLMHDADAVVVPSRHAFPEGLPLTLYEALASRTPVIASDHPMFGGHLEHGQSALVFPASRPDALAQAVRDLMGDPALYARISAGAADAWQRMQIPVKWGEMIDRWMADGPEDRHWLASHTLDAGAASEEEAA